MSSAGGAPAAGSSPDFTKVPLEKLSQSAPTDAPAKAKEAAAAAAKEAQIKTAAEPALKQAAAEQSDRAVDDIDWNQPISPTGAELTAEQQVKAVSIKNVLHKNVGDKLYRIKQLQQEIRGGQHSDTEIADMGLEMRTLVDEMDKEIAAAKAEYAKHIPAIDIEGDFVFINFDMQMLNLRMFEELNQKAVDEAVQATVDRFRLGPSAELTGMHDELESFEKDPNADDEDVVKAKFERMTSKLDAMEKEIQAMKKYAKLAPHLYGEGSEFAKLEQEHAALKVMKNRLDPAQKPALDHALARAVIADVTQKLLKELNAVKAQIEVLKREHGAMDRAEIRARRNQIHEMINSVKTGSASLQGYASADPEAFAKDSPLSVLTVGLYVVDADLEALEKQLNPVPAQAADNAAEEKFVSEQIQKTVNQTLDHVDEQTLKAKALLKTLQSEDAELAEGAEKDYFTTYEQAQPAHQILVKAQQDLDNVDKAMAALHNHIPATKALRNREAGLRIRVRDLRQRYLDLFDEPKTATSSRSSSPASTTSSSGSVSPTNTVVTEAAAASKALRYVGAAAQLVAKQEGGWSPRQQQEFDDYINSIEIE